MLKKISLYGVLILLLFTIAACDSSVNSSVKNYEKHALMQSGSQLLYLQKIKLPEGASLEVRLEDAAASTLISSKSVTLKGRPPYLLELDYPENSIEHNHIYRLRSVITIDGKPLLVSSQSINSFLLEIKQPLEIKIDPVDRSGKF
ncbi:YbaY family lipoprotein [Psychromonas ossibalaenae]|uniref:YbaY family lipoprotein n=1 Tax=Psychromonas ossibalaenae TaxID=444922 RepID=UPI001469A74F|nr:YbaY family lipoprotein [Psychromonas ossibalaenae]